MTKHSRLLCAMLLASACHAQSWVSTNGNDTGTCTRSAPCRSFFYAIEHTAAGGQINVGDAGDYGTASITKSMTIDGGNLATVVSSSTSSIDVGAGPKDVVILRNMTLHTSVTGQSYGITFSSGSQLIVENVKISGFGIAILADLTTGGGTTTAGDLVVRNSSIDNCGEAINVAGGGSNITTEIVNTHVSSTTFGLLAYVGRVRISGSTFSGAANAPVGMIQVGIELQATTEVMVDDCEFSGFTNGILLHAGTLTLSRSTVAYNTTGVSATAGTLISNGNNSLFGNTTDGTFTKTVALR